MHLLNSRDEELELGEKLRCCLDVGVSFGILRQIVQTESARDNHNQYFVELASDLKNVFREVLKL